MEKIKICDKSPLLKIQKLKIYICDWSESCISLPQIFGFQDILILFSKYRITISKCHHFKFIKLYVIKYQSY